MFINNKTHILLPSYERSVENTSLDVNNIAELIENELDEASEIAEGYSVREKDKEALDILYDTPSFNAASCVFNHEELKKLNTNFCPIDEYLNELNELSRNIQTAWIEKKYKNIKDEINSDCRDCYADGIFPLSTIYEKEYFLNMVTGVFDEKFVNTISKITNDLYEFLVSNIDFEVLKNENLGDAEVIRFAMNVYYDFAHMVISSYAISYHACLRIAEYLLKLGDTAYEEVDDDTPSKTVGGIESFEYGLEVAANYAGAAQKQKSGVLGAIGQLQAIPGMLNTITKKAALMKRKSKNATFWKKFQGRVPHLYQRYGDEAEIRENRMIDDPVQILKGRATEYINIFTKDVNAIYDELKKLYDATQGLNNSEKALSLTRKYCEAYAVSMENIKEFPNAMKMATKKKIAQAILKDNVVYGYTVESMVDKDFPPANHVIVSLFVENAHEGATVQHVTDIIKSEDSFRLIMADEKKPIFQCSEASHNLLSKGIQASDVKAIKTASKASLGELKKGSAQQEKAQNAGVVEGNNKQLASSKATVIQMKYIWKGIETAMNLVISMKKYSAQLIDNYFSMVLRIDNLCKQCVVAMLDVEQKYKVKNHDTGFKSSQVGSYQGYRQLDQDENLERGRALSKQEKKAQAKEERKSARKERMSQIQDLMEQNRSGRII